MSSLISAAFLSLIFSISSLNNLNLNNLQNKDFKKDFDYSLGEPSEVKKIKYDADFISYERRLNKEYNFKYHLYDLNIYKYPRFIDVKIRDIYNRRVEPGQTINFTVNFTNTVQESFRTSFSEVYEQFNQVKHMVTLKNSIGFKIDGYLGLVKHNYTEKNSYNITYSENFKNSIENSVSYARTYGVEIRDNFSYTNNNNFDVFHTLCYREKYEVYKLNLTYYVPEQTKNDRNIHGVNYSYKVDSIYQKDFYLLVPAYESIYIDQCSYARDINGNIFNINSKFENNVIYL